VTGKWPRARDKLTIRVDGDNFDKMDVMMNRLGSRRGLSFLLLTLLGFLLASTASIADTGRFLLVSDIHFNPFYDGSLFNSLRDQPVEAWAEILKKTRPAGFNPVGTDTNFALLQSSLHEVHNRLPDPDFILYPGDLMAHEWQARYDRLALRSHLQDPAAYRAFTTKAIRFLAAEFRRRYPSTAILPTLGNDDSYCGDYMIEPDGPFLKMFAQVWAPLIGAEEDAETFRSTFERGGYYTLRLPQLRKHRLIVLNSVFFSVNYLNACGTSTQTPALDELRWLEQTLQRASGEGEKVWLLMHVPAGINSYNSVEGVTRGGPPVTFWQPELTSVFKQIVQRHASSLDIAFVGHTHMDDFRVLGFDGKPVLLCKIAPAISPIFGNNPGYQIYQYDRETGAVSNYQTYYLTNLDTRNIPLPQTPRAGSWALEYDFQGAYGLPVLTAQTIAELARAMQTNAALQAKYTQYYGVSAPAEFTPQQFPIYRCAIGNITPAEFLECLTGVPKPTHPPVLPDRKPRAGSITSKPS
jgi:hypothetical protein